MNCMDCAAEADVVIENACFCCEHYAVRAMQMRRNANRLIFEAGVCRYPTEEESEIRRKMELKRAERWIRRSKPRSEGLKKIQVFLGRRHGRQTE